VGSRPWAAAVPLAACLLLAACGGSKGTVASVATGGGSVPRGGQAALPKGTTAAAQLKADTGCKPTPQPTGQVHWAVTAGTGNPAYTLPALTPQVGSSLASWPAQPMAVLGDCTDTEGWVWAAGDAKNFYLAVQVDSTLPPVDGTQAAPWSGDVVQFAFDPLDDKETSGYGSDDVEAGMALISGQPFLFINDTGGSEVTPAAIPGGKVSITRQNGITLYEAAIPWAAIGATVEPTFGFNVAFGAGGPDYQGPNWGYEWTQGLIGSKTPADFAQITFKR
jgi:hypothetical protein